MTFAIVNEDDFPAKIKSFGFEDSGEDINIGIMDGKGKTYSMEEMEEFDSDDIRDFISKFNKGTSLYVKIHTNYLFIYMKLRRSRDCFFLLSFGYIN